MAEGNVLRGDRAPVTVPAVPSPTVIPAQTRVEGRIVTAHDLRIEGRCDGHAESGGTLTVAAGATVQAELRAPTAEIYGEVIGNIVCTDRILVARGARVVGDLRAPDIEVDGGAEVDGRLSLLPPAPREAPHKRVRLSARGTPLRRPSAPPRPAPSAAIATDRSAGEHIAAPSPDRLIPAAPRPRGRTRVRPRRPTRDDG
jgi:cytoskeletal protein CcmA (bactofilin family)